MNEDTVAEYRRLDDPNSTPTTTPTNPPKRPGKKLSHKQAKRVKETGSIDLPPHLRNPGPASPPIDPPTPTPQPPPTPQHSDISTYTLDAPFLPWQPIRPTVLSNEMLKIDGQCFLPIIEDLPRSWIKKAVFMMEFFVGVGRFNDYKTTIPGLVRDDFEHEFGKVWFWPVAASVVKPKYVWAGKLEDFVETCGWKCSNCKKQHVLSLGVIMLIALGLVSRDGWTQYVNGTLVKSYRLDLANFFRPLRIEPFTWRGCGL